MSRPTHITINQPSRTEYVTREVHEHRAPTDQSVALLREMEAKARAQVEAAVRLEGNGFECVVHTERDYMSDDVVAVVLFALNGKRMKSETRLSRKQTESPVVAAQQIRDDLAKVIATEMLMQTIGPALSRILI